jgi:hypothetical protein
MTDLGRLGRKEIGDRGKPSRFSFPMGGGGLEIGDESWENLPCMKSRVRLVMMGVFKNVYILVDDNVPHAEMKPHP